jgi:hypothetical protein
MQGREQFAGSPKTPPIPNMLKGSQVWRGGVVLRARYDFGREVFD